MKLDNFVKAAFLGALATVITEIVTCIFKWVGIIDTDIYTYNSLWITMNRPSWFFGMTTHIILGGAQAFVLYWFLDKVSSQNIIIKAIGLNLVSWYILRLYSVAFIEGRITEPRPFEKIYMNIASAAVNGLALGILLRAVIFRKLKKAVM